MSIYSNFGFDETRTESAADSPKYKLLNTLKQLGIEQFPIEQANDIFSQVQQALAESGLYSFDAKNANIDLTKDRGGYVGIRPIDRSNPTGPQTFQWMAYNDAVKPQGGWQPGDYGDGSPYGDWHGQGSGSTGASAPAPERLQPVPDNNPQGRTPPYRPQVEPDKSFAPSAGAGSAPIATAGSVDLAEALRRISKALSGGGNDGDSRI